jgi:hypothetical protein
VRKSESTAVQRETENEALLAKTEALEAELLSMKAKVDSSNF